jgi:phosphoglycolate phosphatase
MRFRTVLLDLDGTLIDHFTAIHRCHANVRRHFGLPEPTPEEVRRAVGGGLENALRRLLGPAHADKVEVGLAVYRAHWDLTLLDDVTDLPGAMPLLAALKAAGIRPAVLTNKHAGSSRQICTHLGMDPYLAGVFGAGDTPWLKPDPRFSQHALRALGAEAGSTLLVGDSPYDVQTGKNAGFAMWAVTTGTHSAEELQSAGADRILPGLKEVITQLGLAKG